MTDDLTRLSIGELVAEQAAGRLSALDVARDALARLAGPAGELRAVVACDGEDVLRQARAVDARRARGQDVGPLAGVVVTVKDSFEVAGLHACQGTPDSVHVAKTDAPAVARLRAAGALVLGKTNLPPHLADYRSDNAVHGRTLNPWDVGRTPGGSSGGSAAAVASGLSWGDLGSDLTGSIRVPAAWCGVHGHRPSNGVVSKRGHLPWPVDSRLDAPVSVAGPLARRAQDLLALFRVLAGPAGAAARAWRLQLPEPTATALPGLRVGLWLDEPTAPVDAEVRAAVVSLAEALRDAGCAVTELGSSPLAAPRALELGARLVEHEITHGADPAGGWRQVPAAPSASGAPALWVARAWADAEEAQRLREAWEEGVAHVDVVLAPVVPFTAPRHEQLDDDDPSLPRALGEPAASPRDLVGRWSRLANLTTGPATVVPLGLGAHSRLPVAAQLLAPFGGDLTTLAVACLLERHGLTSVPEPGPERH